jgi:tetratricopeptide (TPR) repeat protein
MVLPMLCRTLTGGLLAAALTLSSLSAKEPEHSVAMAEIAFAEGVQAFENGADQVAAERFRESLQNDPRNGTPHYWLGLTLLRLGQAREAVQEIQAGLAARQPAQVEPRRALADLGAAQLAAGDARAAAELLAKALAGKDDDAPTLYRYGEALRQLDRREEGDAAIARAVGLDPALASGPIPIVAPEPWGELPPIDRRPLWDGRLGIAFADDSNPNLLPEDLLLPIPGPPPQRLVSGAQSDGVADLDLRLGFQPIYQREGWNVGASLDAGRSFHRELKYLDLGQARACVHLARGADPLGSLRGPLGSTQVPFGNSRYSVLLQGGASYYQLDGTTFLRTWDGAASLILRPTPDTSTQLGLAFSDREFSDRGLGNARRSGQDLILRLGQSFFFKRRDRSLRLTAVAGDRNAGRAFSASFVEGGIELALPLAPWWPRWSLQAAGSLRKDGFDHQESNLFNPSGPPRKDTTARTTVALVWESSVQLRWTLRGTYVDRNSNVSLMSALPPALPALDYTRTLASLGVSWFF